MTGTIEILERTNEHSHPKSFLRTTVQNPHAQKFLLFQRMAFRMWYATHENRKIIDCPLCVSLTWFILHGAFISSFQHVIFVV